MVPAAAAPSAPRVKAAPPGSSRRNVLIVDRPFSEQPLQQRPYFISRHLRAVSEWGISVDLPDADRGDGLSWEATGVLPPQVRQNITQDELESGSILAAITPRMETVNRGQTRAGEAALVPRPPTEPVRRIFQDRKYQGPAALRGRAVRWV